METMIETAAIAGTLAFAGWLRKKDAPKAMRVYAATFVFMMAVWVAFGAAQGAAAMGAIPAAPSFSPAEVLSLAAVLFWASFAAEKGGMLGREMGE